jgi:hypothetical protein
VSALATLPELSPFAEERRRHGRVKIRLPGRFMRANREEYPCMTIDMSPGGVAFESEEPVSVGERIVSYVEQIGRLEGRVVREFDEGFAISMKLPPSKRERLAVQLTWMVNRQGLGLPEDRRHERIRPRHIRTTLILPRGREVLATIVDVSQSGVALRLSHPVDPAVGTPVVVGATPGQIVRSFGDGVAVEFSRVIPAEAFDADVTL